MTKIYLLSHEKKKPSLYVASSCRQDKQNTEGAFNWGWLMCEPVSCAHFAIELSDLRDFNHGFSALVVLCRGDCLAKL